MKNPTNDNVKALVTEDESSHVLGCKWNYQYNTLVVSRGTIPEHSCAVTQRVVHILVSTVYDPNGLVALYTVKTQLLLKDIWRLSGQQWDDNLSNHNADILLEWSDEITKLTEKTIAGRRFKG